MGELDKNLGVSEAAVPTKENEKPKTAEELAAAKKAEAAKTAAQTATKVATDLGPDIDAGLNQPIKTPDEGNAPAEGAPVVEEAQPEIALSAVQPLMQRKNSELNDEEAKLLANYYTQEAKKADNAGETFKAIMFHVRAFLASTKLDFLSAPEEMTKGKEGETTAGNTEAPLAAPTEIEKPTAIEEAAKKVEVATNVSALTLLAIAKVENKDFKEETLKLIANDVIAKLGKEKPITNDPVKCMISYLEAKTASSAEYAQNPTNGLKLVAKEFTKYHLAISGLYTSKSITYNSYYEWITKAQANSTVKDVVKSNTENIVPGTLYNMLSPKYKKRLPPERIANVNLIEKMTLAAGYSIRMAAAMVVNAWHESGGLQADIIGDNGNSVGLFQLHKKGRGHGMTVAERQNPEKNIQRILEGMEKEKITHKGKKTNFREVDRLGASIEDLTKLFCWYIERPKKRAEATANRGTASHSMFA